MSRLGKLAIKLPEKVQAKLEGEEIVISGPKGELRQLIKKPVLVKILDGEVQVSVDEKAKEAKAFWGLFRSLINNMVLGVSEGFTRKLEINGVGYRVALAGDKLNLNLGYSHPIEFPLPKGVSAVVEANTIILSSIDKELLGNTAFNIRKLRKPEPYKGKGIKYAEEQIRRKAGKTAAK